MDTNETDRTRDKGQDMDLLEMWVGQELAAEERDEIERERARKRAEDEKFAAEDAEWERWSFAARLSATNDPKRMLTVWRFPNPGLRDEFVEIAARRGVDETGDLDGDAGFFPQCGIFPIGRAFVRRNLEIQGVWKDARHDRRAGVIRGVQADYDGCYRGPELPGQLPPVCEVATMGITTEERDASTAWD